MKIASTKLIGERKMHKIHVACTQNAASVTGVDCSARARTNQTKRLMKTIEQFIRKGSPMEEERDYMLGRI